jgi:muramidase (phage lysozyme)
MNLRNRKAFKDMLAVSEGTSTSPVTQNDGYDVIVTGVNGPEIFTDYAEHPFAHRSPKKINNTGLYSSASGRYQFMRVHWSHYKTLLKLPDFSPASQEKWCDQLLKEQKALPLIDAGDFDNAVARCRNIWASLPGAGYGQHENSLDKLRQVYVNAGGTLINV